MFAMDTINQGFRRDAFFFRAKHDGGAVRVVGTYVIYLVSLHFLEAYPDVGLNILHQMAKMNAAVRIRQGGSNQNFSLVHQLPMEMDQVWIVANCGAAVI